jgi:hypothetical protein
MEQRGAVFENGLFGLKNPTELPNKVALKALPTDQLQKISVLNLTQ